MWWSLGNDNNIMLGRLMHQKNFVCKLLLWFSSIAQYDVYQPIYLKLLKIFKSGLHFKSLLVDVRKIYFLFSFDSIQKIIEDTK